MNFKDALKEMLNGAIVSDNNKPWFQYWIDESNDHLVIVAKSNRSGDEYHYDLSAMDTSFEYQIVEKHYSYNEIMDDANEIIHNDAYMKFYGIPLASWFSDVYKSSMPEMVKDIILNVSTYPEIQESVNNEIKSIRYCKQYLNQNGYLPE